jgi:hypothetical protein
MTRARDNAFNPFNNQVAGKNMVINGAFDYWQRGTSFTTGAFQYSADRWRIGRGAFQTGGTYTRQNANLEGFRYCMRVQRDIGGNGVGGGYVATSFETSESLRFSGKIVTLSFYARKSASYTGGGFSVAFQYGTGVDETGFAEGNFATGATNIFNSSVTGLTTSWQRFTLTGLVPSNATQLGIRIIVEYAGVAPADDYAEITGVQLELGSSATSFSRSAGTIGGELSLCQRYYQKSYSQGTNPATNNSPGAEVRMGASRTDQYATDSSFSFPVAMRIPPAVLLYSSTNSTVNSIYDAGAGANRSAAVFNIGDNRAQIGLGSGVTTTANTAYVWHWVASSEL